MNALVRVAGGIQSRLSWRRRMNITIPSRSENILIIVIKVPFVALNLLPPAGEGDSLIFLKVPSKGEHWLRLQDFSQAGELFYGQGLRPSSRVYPHSLHLPLNLNGN